MYSYTTTVKKVKVDKKRKALTEHIHDHGSGCWSCDVVVEGLTRVGGMEIRSIHIGNCNRDAGCVRIHVVGQCHAMRLQQCALAPPPELGPGTPCKCKRCRKFVRCKFTDSASKELQNSLFTDFRRIHQET